MRNIFLLCCIFFFFNALHAQDKNSAYQLHIRKASSPIVIDGEMNEPSWQEADVAKNFWQILPMDTSHAIMPTEVRMTYDNTKLYILAICYTARGVPYMVESLRRDWNFLKNDNFIFCIDPFEDRTNGLTFGANAAGAQYDGMLYEGGSNNLDWDNKWVSAVKNYPDKYIFEAAIPFKTIRYKKDNLQWGINFSRLDINVAEKSSWAPVPRQFPSVSLAYTGVLVWDQPPPPPGLNISVIPYALAGVSKDYENDTKTKLRGNIGGDAKIGLTSSLNLDLTVNPDYSQVEVDRQVTNLDRYELFFPEKRQFFLENSDLFANFGYQDIRPFFSRRIGLNVPISFGARLSGSLDKNWRIGVMDMQTKSVDATGLPVQNFAVLALQRRVFSRSNIRFLFVNKQSFNYELPKDSTLPVYSLYNRNVGVEYNLASANNLWTGKAMLLKSFSPGGAGKDFTFANNIQYLNRHWKISWQNEIVGENFTAEAGYVPRKDYVKINPQLAYLFFPKKGVVLSHGPGINSTYFFNTSMKQTDNENILSYQFNFRDQSAAHAWVSHDYVELLQAFDPTNSDKDTLATGTHHRWDAFGADYVSKPQSLFTYDFSTRIGGYYANGSRLSFSGDIGYRFQPFVNLSLNASYNHIHLPMPWNVSDFWLVGPHVDVTFTNNLYFTTFLQYNSQLNNINLNMRLQWRYKPASDFYIVYTDNYYPAPFSVRNRAVVLKFTYWWNM